jgi:hypothetical protein
LTHYLPRPQIEGKFQLVWVLIDHKIHYCGPLPWLKLASSLRTPSLFGLQCFLSTLLISSHPGRNCTTTDAKNLGRPEVFHP